MKVITETKLRYLGSEYYVFQDKEGKIVWPAIDFLINRVNNKDSISTVATYRQALKRLYGFLDAKNLNWLSMNDTRLVQFAEWCLQLTIKDPRYRGNEITAKQTVNHDYLEPVYTFYYWAQKQKRYTQTILGPNSPEGASFQITSELPNREEARRNGTKEPKRKFLYPKLFKNIRKSSTSSAKTASENQIIELQDYIIQNFSGYESESLLILTRIIRETGARPIAMASFVQSQFISNNIDKELFDDTNNKLKVKPLKQKGGNTMPIEFPLGTALAVKTYIRDTLKPFIAKHKYQHHNGHLFINPKTGTPLSANNITKIFSVITTNLGWPKGQSLYSLRHRYANDELDRELAINHELGYDSSEPTIRLQVSKKMTHRNKKSLDNYIESRQRYGAKTTASRQANKIKELETTITTQALETKLALEKAQKKNEIAEKTIEENSQLKAKISILETEIANIKKET